MDIEEVRRLIPQVTDEEATALIEWYANITGGVAAFPADDLKTVEPPLRSTPGPHL